MVLDVADQATREEVVRLWRLGYSTREIAPLVGISKSRVHQLLADEPQRPPLGEAPPGPGALTLAAPDLTAAELRTLLRNALRHVGRALE